MCVMCCCSTGACPLGSMRVGCATRYPLSSMIKHLPHNKQRGEPPIRPPRALERYGEMKHDLKFTARGTIFKGFHLLK